MLAEAAGGIKTIFTHDILDRSTASGTNLLQSTMI
jgi:hypothetical protein